MSNPNMSGIPGVGAMTDTLDFVKKMWGGMNIPGMVMPSLSVNDINKQIADLKAVESWLTLNMNMLRGTIQALEVQAATISTLQSMSENFGAVMYPQQTPVAAETASPNGANQGNGSHDAAKSSDAPRPTKKDEQDAASLTAPLVNAAAWWNMLQDQFTQAVGSAMTGEPLTAYAEKEEKPKAKAKAKTTSSTTARKRKSAR